MSQELLPCPFCGSDDVVVEAAMSDPPEFYVVCQGCSGSAQHPQDWNTRSAPPVADSFQARVRPWMLECFGEEIASDVVERCDRLIEEVLERVQVEGYDPARVQTLVDYVYGRPVGERGQETGGVMVTLAALCLATGGDMHEAGEVELARIWTKVEQIRAKQLSKRGMHTPLPVAPPPVAVGVEEIARIIDPKAWKLFDEESRPRPKNPEVLYWKEYYRLGLRRSLETATAILALLNPSPTDARSSMVEPSAHNGSVAGSSPAGRTNSPTEAQASPDPACDQPTEARVGPASSASTSPTGEKP